MAEPESMPIFEFRNVSLRTETKTVLDNFNLTVRSGEKVMMTGPSGVGKTTILRLPLGFRRPDAGQVLFRGQPVNGPTAWRIRREVAYVSQDVALGHGTAREFIDRTFSYRANMAAKPTAAALEGTLERLHLPTAILAQELADVSGGEKQRLGILVALLLGRRVFLLDEITSALDPALKAEMLTIFLENPDWTVLAVSHDTPPSLPAVRQVKLNP